MNSMTIFDKVLKLLGGGKSSATAFWAPVSGKMVVRSDQKVSMFPTGNGNFGLSGTVVNFGIVKIVTVNFLGFIQKYLIFIRSHCIISLCNNSIYAKLQKSPRDRLRAI